ncbi:TauD/TfdA family dioxygenase [Acidobacteria bacterium AH-259-D05]|nr:TauD/TfdA family dioxygenase [Acidobacteria bacterium AH-259-D05]
MSIVVEPLSSALGAEIRGVDLRHDLSLEIVSQIVDAFSEHLVILFRDQELTEEQQLHFAGYLGEIGQRSLPRDQWPEGRDHNPAIMLISNIREKGKLIGSLPDGELWFHHDMCYVEAPPKATLLYAVEVPAQGGNTRFANMYKAYDALSDTVQEKISGQKALQIYDYKTTEKVDLEGDISQIAHYLQPVAITHPITKRKALYVNPLITARIEGLPSQESDALLEELLRFTKSPEMIYEHRWRPGDLLVWDNLCSCHARTDFSSFERRLLRRCTLLGLPLNE